MREIDDDVWKRRGFSVLWDARVLGGLSPDTSSIRSLRWLFCIKGDWPDDLPYSDGQALVITGLEGCLDRLSPADAATWLEDKLRPLLLGFQRHYDDAALVLWLPTGERRVDEVAVDDTCSWRAAPPYQRETLPLPRAMFGGAYRDVGKIMWRNADALQPTKPSWVGLHLQRIA